MLLLPRSFLVVAAFGGKLDQRKSVRNLQLLTLVMKEQEAS